MIKILKKAVAVLAVAGIALSSNTMTYAKSTEDFKDFALLEALKIADSEAMLDAAATRADLARIGLRLTDRSDIYDSANAEEIYTDVAGSEYASDIYGAYVSGIMVGDDTGKFNPEELISYEMLTTVMGRVCGYGGLDKSLWASFGFADLKLFEDVSLSDPITLGELFAVAQNCLDAEVIEMKPSGSGKEYEKSGVTVLEHYFDVYEGTGIVSVNSVTGLFHSSTSTRVDNVIINNVTYDTGSTNAAELFGLNCDFYYLDRDDDIPQLIYIKKNKNAEMLTIESDDVIRYADGRYTYHDGKRDKTLNSVSKTADIIYNGKPLANPDDTVFDEPIWYGEVTLIDNYGKGEYDVVFIYNYKNYIVGSIDEINNVIYDTENNTSINLGDEIDFDIYVNGEQGELEDVAIDAVASVFEARDGYKLIYINKEKISSKIDSVSVGDNEIIIDGIAYKTTDAGILTEAMQHLGDTVSVYIDGAKRIAYIDYSNQSSDGKYGIVTSVNLNDTQDLLRVKIYTQDSEFKSFYTGDRFQLNGSSVKITDGATGWAELWDNAVIDNRKLVRYTVSEDEILTEIEIPVDTTYNDLYNGSEYTDFRRVYQADTSNQLYYKTAGTHFVNMNTSILAAPTTFEPNSSTLVFVMPEDVSADSSYYAMGNMNQFTNNERVAADMYRTSDSKLISAMLIVGSETRKPDYGNVLVVNRIGEVINEDNEVAVSISGTVNDKTEQTLVIKGNDSFTFTDGRTLEQFAKDLDRGDFLVYQKNTKGEIIYFQELYDAGTQTAVAPTETLTVDTARAIYGTITGYKDGIITIFDSINNVEQSYKYSGNVIVHNVNKQVQRIGTAEEFVYGKNLCIYVQESRMRAAVIYE